MTSFDLVLLLLFYSSFSFPILIGSSLCTVRVPEFPYSLASCAPYPDLTAPNSYCRNGSCNTVSDPARHANKDAHHPSVG
ncbi:hypothetical protein M747DRAFT_67091 [Aspergillus niger ATCC 13496]|uniref:Secreted protein n=1 Tax=Aspergillus niger ATCC 13496 TaxID=1353008 RepID=A0A370BUK0_ASPNG|nr:hypothetical protein M747DRAFT_67091 [Aspergillus niger ATCC 13496]